MLAGQLLGEQVGDEQVLLVAVEMHEVAMWALSRCCWSLAGSKGGRYLVAGRDVEGRVIY